jgi:hypothetical protein
MSILILNRGPLAQRPYHEWLAGYPGDLLLLASQEELTRRGHSLPPLEAGYSHVEAVAGYEDPGTIEARALELAKHHDITHVFASQEHDLERAAAIRERLGVPGQSLQSATAFRDKLVMKRYAQAGGIKVAPHAPVATASELRSFADTHGLPVVVKPRDGSSSVGLAILRTPEQLDSYLGGFEATGLLAEAYVDGSMFHVDGMVRGGKLAVAWPSEYLYQLAAFGQDSKPRLDVALDQGDPLGDRLIALVEQVFAALPTPADTTFHCEVFHTPDDELVLCEIASRNGGALIKSVLQAMFGVDFPVAWLRASAGLPIDVPGDGTRMVPRQLAGQLLLLKRPGRVLATPGRPPFAWIERFEQYVQPGDEVAGATSSGDFMTAMVVSAPDRATCEARLREAADWFNAHLVIEPLPAQTLSQLALTQ